MVLNHAADQARKAKDYAKLRDTLAELSSLLPGNASILYALAAADAHLGRPARALAELDDLAGAGLVYGFNADDDLASLRNSAGFSSLLLRVERNRKPTSRSVPVSSLAERDLLPEDIAYDEETRRFFIGSVTKCKIVTADGALFAKSDWPVMALRVDAARRILWAATGWLAHCRQCDAAGKDKSALLAFDLDSGALRKRIDAPVEGLLGDMTISRAGDLYVSEGTYGAVLRLQANAATLERLDTPGEFASPQTAALSADERTLYVPDYVRGIAAMDLQTRAVRWLRPAADVVLSGIDGFYRYGDSFIAVQNGVKPERLVRFNSSLTKQEILEAGTPGLGEPTHGTLVGNVFYFIANTGWDAYDDDGHKKPGSAPVESQIRKIVLAKAG
jgi:sugar lactone lactonase YvrE